MSITIQEFSDLRAAGNSTAAMAALSAPVKFDPPVPLADARVPACPACGEGTMFVHVCGKCGSTDDDNPYCCGQPMLIRGAYVSILAGAHSFLGCPLLAA
jgi:hypothetical protein